MLSNKTWRIAGAAMLGTAVLLGTNAANARIDLDAEDESKPAVTYAKELLSKASVVEAGGKMYYGVTDSALAVTSALGFGTTGDKSVSVTYTFTGAVFSKQVPDMAISADMGDGADITLGSRNVGAKGAKGESVVEFVVDGPGAGFSQTDELTFSLGGENGGGIAVSADEPVTISVTMVEREGNNPRSNTADRSGALAVVPAVMVMSTPLDLVAANDSDFKTFVAPVISPMVSDTTGSVGGFTVTEQTTVLKPADGSAVAAGDVIERGQDTVNDAADAADSSVIVKGDFSFASTVHFDGSRDCSEGSPTDVRMALVDDVRDTARLQQQDLQYASGKFLCITLVADSGGEQLPRSAEYVAEITYAPGTEVPAEANRVYFPPTANMATLGSISRGGVSVQLPYLTINPRFKQRIRVANRGSFDATYSMEFHGDGDTAGADATGEFTAGMTTILQVPDVVTPGNGYNTAATLDIKAAGGTIDVVTVQTNLDLGTTDTVVLTKTY